MEISYSIWGSFLDFAGSFPRSLFPRETFPLDQILTTCASLLILQDPFNWPSFFIINDLWRWMRIRVGVDSEIFMDRSKE